MVERSLMAFLHKSSRNDSMLFDKNDAQLVLLSCQEDVYTKSTDPEEFFAQIQKLSRVAQIFQIPIWSVVHMPIVQRLRHFGASPQPCSQFFWGQCAQLAQTPSKTG
jgi:hypothetical protein